MGKGVAVPRTAWQLDGKSVCICTWPPEIWFAKAIQCGLAAEPGDADAWLASTMANIGRVFERKFNAKEDGVGEKVEWKNKTTQMISNQSSVSCIN